MSEWREVKLGNIVTSNNQSIGKNYEYETIQYLDTGSITNGKIEGYQKVNISDAPSRAKRLVKHEDIIYSTVRPIQRHFGFMQNPIDTLVVSTGFSVIEVNQELANPKFVYYYLSSNETVEVLDVIAEASTTTYPSLKPKDIENLDILLPPLKEQKEIAEVLSSLDDKIDLLHRQNKTLEALAQTLFRQWFVEGKNCRDKACLVSTGDWEECKLSDVLEIKYGKDHKKLADGNIPVYGSGGIMRYADSFLYDKESILIPKKGTLTNLFYIDEPFWTVDTIFWSKINSEKVSGKFLFSFLKTMDLSNLNVGSAVPSLTTKVLNEIKILLPSLEEQKEFNEYADNAWVKTKSNLKQIKTLENLRDTLLPKLMSGEVKVKP